MVMSMFSLLTVLEDVSSASTSEAGTSSSGSSSTEKITETLKNMVKSPIFYIVLGAIVLLIIAVYLIRRFIKARPGVVKVVVRHGQIRRLVDEKNPKYFLVPFVDSVGAEIPLDEQTMSSDKLFINNGPDSLYKVNYTLQYKVTDVKEFYPYVNKIQEIMVLKINDGLREYADKGHAFVIVKDYREKEQEILSIINQSLESYKVEATSFKVNFIEPMGGK